MDADDRISWRDEFEYRPDGQCYLWAGPRGRGDASRPPAIVPTTPPTNMPRRLPSDIQASLEQAAKVLEFVRRHPTMQPEITNMLLQRVLDDLLAVVARPGTRPA